MNINIITSIIAKNKKHLILVPNISIEKYIFLMPQKHKIGLFLLSCRNGITEYLHLLLRYTDLNYSIFSVRHLQVVKILVSHKNISNKEISNIFLEACLNEKYDIIEYLLPDERISPSMIVRAVRTKYIDKSIVKLLLKDKRAKNALSVYEYNERLLKSIWK